MKNSLQLAFALISSFSLSFAIQASADSGIESRPINEVLAISELPPGTSNPARLVRVFPRLGFFEATYCLQLPDGTGDFLVSEKLGRIHRIPNTTDPAPGDVVKVLDINSRIATESYEQGLVGFAVDPYFVENGFLYVLYSSNVGNTITLSRFQLSGMEPIDPATEEILFAFPMPHYIHNGGLPIFGPDGYLYISTGDGGPYGDPYNNAQNLASPLGKILRIDVHGTPDPGLAYRIPPDNPFVNGDPDGGPAAPEVYAYGLRNPFRMTIDPPTGNIFAADVGQGAFEEVNLILPGLNYGWKIREANICFDPPGNCRIEGLTPPIYAYPHSEGNSVTGGHVYRGRALPSLVGKYIFGDWGYGWIRAIQFENGALTGPETIIDNSGLMVSGFGLDLEGELYVVAYDFSAPGGIYKLVPLEEGTGSRIQAKVANLLKQDDPSISDPNEDQILDAADIIRLLFDEDALNTFPKRLSEIPALLAAGNGADQTNLGIIPYIPSATLWSDGTLKERYFALPGTTRMRYRPEGSFDFPNDSILIKNFVMPLDERDTSLGGTRLETRLMLRKENRWHGFTYRWNEEETDAELVGIDGDDRIVSYVDKDGMPSALRWRYPSRRECMQCHTAASNQALGLTAAQLNCEITYPASGVRANQLRTLNTISLFETELPGPVEKLPAAPDYRNEDASLRDRARAYLFANCASCHQPGGPAPTYLDLRWSTSTSAMSAIDMAPLADDLGLPGARLLTMGQPDQSLLYLRMAARGTDYQMPPLATHRVDEYGLQLIRDWISGLGDVTNDPFEVLDLLHPAFWASSTEGEGLDGVNFFARNGLHVGPNRWNFQAYGRWRPKHPLAPLPAGRYRLDALFELSDIQPWEYAPEYTVRVWLDQDSADTTLATRSILTLLDEPRPTELSLYFESDGTTPWGISLESHAFSQPRFGGPHFRKLSLTPVDVEEFETISVQAPIIRTPTMLETVSGAGNAITLRWRQAWSGRRAEKFEIYRDLPHSEYPEPDPPHGTHYSELLGETEGFNFTIPRSFPAGSWQTFRVVAVRGNQRAASSTLRVRIAN